ncbi:hypothetical protein DI272_13945 [Streptomyces sp. Act143]|uniref:hypothetical protein n=1 Tax=Streptomyces sp. Act143 TaxID=2200760 RepID=UPI000D67CCBB|nr:hypothetical protein [Streptomyces sp. Act143]PWI15146.1 hypothetical protein DI272_13945 [Streptomyces sp. Act143]
MITHSDEGPDVDPDDPLLVVLRPPAAYLGPPPGRFEAVRRGAARRKLLRAAAGAAVACGIAALVVLPLSRGTSDGPARPTVPLAPPSASSPVPTPERGTPGPNPGPSRRPSSTPSPVPTAGPSDSTVVPVPGDDRTAYRR